MNKIISGCTAAALLLVAGCGPTQIPELTMKAEYRPSAQIKGVSSNGEKKYVAFEEKGNPEKIDVLYCFNGQMFLQTSDGNRNIDQITSADKECEILATFPGEFEKYAAGGFKGWKITPVPPSEALYLYSDAERKSIKNEYKSISLPKQSTIKIVSKELKLAFGRKETVQSKEIIKGQPIALAMKNYVVPPKEFQIEAFSELRNIPDFPDQIKSGYGVVKFLYPWRIQFKFFAYREGATNAEKYKALKGGSDWIDAIYEYDNKGINGERIFRVPVLLPVRDKKLKYGLALRLVFNTDYPDDVLVYPDILKKSLYDKISWTNAKKNNATLDPDFMGSRWNVAVIDEVSGNICTYAQAHFTFNKEHKVSFQANITVSDFSK